MFIVGKLRQWMPIEIAAGLEPVKLLIESIEDKRWNELVDEVEPLKTPGVDGAAPEHNDASELAWLRLVGKEAIKAWKGVGEMAVDADGAAVMDESGRPQTRTIACTPEAIDSLMQHAHIAYRVLAAVRQVNTKLIDEVKEAGNG